MGAQVEAALTEAAAASGGTFGETPPGADLPRLGAVTLSVPDGFALTDVALSHGWSGLAPSSYDVGAGVLHRTLALPGAGPLTVSVRSGRGVVVASWGRTRGTPADRDAVEAAMRRMLAADVDLHSLYAACDAVDGFAWVRASGRGRLLRSPTVWEDALRTLATTNTSWSRTRSLVARLVAELGPTGSAGERAFPGPEAVAAAGAEVLRDAVRAGYRAEPMARFAAAVASGRVDPESWLDPDRSDERLRAEISRLPGFGPFATDTVMGLLGRPRGLTLDAWAARRVARICRLVDADAGGASPEAAEKAAAQRYAPFGRWAGTVCWLEITRPAVTAPEQVAVPAQGATP